ncbi:MAG: AraC family transcriptional activator of pyochelin receptor [Candidatus Azotimanducaceae bacterium]|jgi:AraC family transcriptional activator of pyochelin receptor
MQFHLIERKNNDKSPEIFHDENNKFKVLNIKNETLEDERYFLQLQHNYIQLYFCQNGECSASFNMEHCKINLIGNESSFIYFKDVPSNLLFELKPNSELAVILIPLQHFHSLFSPEENYFFNFENIKMGKPIIEKKPTNQSVKIILHQLFQQKINQSLKSLYVKGKVYELLSLYFNISDENNTEKCPFMANEEVVSQIKQAKDIIIEQMASPPTLEELSKIVGLNIKKLKMGFKELYGMPVFTFLFHYKMEHAKKLLAINGNNVNEVATQIGYSTSSHFIVAFKKKFGITPKQFTKQEINN